MRRGPRGRRASWAHALRSHLCCLPRAPSGAHTSVLHAEPFRFHFLGFCTSCAPASRSLARHCFAPPARGAWGASPSRGEKGGRVPRVGQSRRRGLLADRETARPIVPRAALVQALVKGPFAPGPIIALTFLTSPAPPSPVSAETEDFTLPSQNPSCEDPVGLFGWKV